MDVDAINLLHLRNIISPVYETILILLLVQRYSIPSLVFVSSIKLMRSFQLMMLSISSVGLNQNMFIRLIHFHQRKLIMINSTVIAFLELVFNYCEFPFPTLCVLLANSLYLFCSQIYESKAPVNCCSKCNKSREPQEAIRFRPLLFKKRHSLNRKVKDLFHCLPGYMYHLQW